MHFQHPQIIHDAHAAGFQHGLFARQADEIAIGLQERGPAAVLEPGLHALRDAEVRRAVRRDLPLKRLSQGQKRRAALARLCLSGPVPLWLLDEPFTALDVQGIGLLKELIETHTRRGGMGAYTTHQDPGIAASRVLELG